MTAAVVLDPADAPAAAPAVRGLPARSSFDRQRSTVRDRHARVQRTLMRLASTSDPATRRRLAGDVVLEHQSVAKAIAARYRGRGVDRADLEQLACLGLMKAALRWEAGRSADFLQFAVPTMTGEIKRYFRDQLAMVRPPRRIQEIRAALSVVEEDAAGSSDEQLAESLQTDVSLIREAHRAPNLCRPRSLDEPDAAGNAIGEHIGCDDTALAQMEDRMTVAALLDGLGERDRTILRLRFSEQLSQAEIGDLVGVSQMQVSRILRRILEDLRGKLAS